MTFTITRSISAQHKLTRTLIREGKTIAFVPTMGFLHDGHLALIRRGLQKADVVVTSIFVNPAQFAPHEDFARYPRDTKGDLAKIRRAGGQVVFLPRAADMYPEDYQTFVTVDRLGALLEGKIRPGHFTGVATVVAKLFNIVQPDFALFGMKDYQQAMLLRRMTAELNWPIRFIICPTRRERDGLAMSSRNSYLSPNERRQAPALYRALQCARTLVGSGTTATQRIDTAMRRVIAEIAPESAVEYIAFTEMESLRAVSKVGEDTVISLAVRLGPVRLIDNMRVSAARPAKQDARFRPDGSPV